MKRFNPLKSSIILLKYLYLKYINYLLNRKVTSGIGKIYLTYPLLKVSIIVEKNAQFILNGTLRIVSHLGGENPVLIHISKDSCLSINGDFLIGNGVRVFLRKGSKLTIGGKCYESISGITENCKIMVYNSISIGSDLLCAWDVFISDSDWHLINRYGTTSDHHADIVIGDHVWIAPGCNILKGTNIGDGSIIANKSTTNKSYPTNTLIAGNPAKAIQHNINWSRDII